MFLTSDSSGAQTHRARKVDIFIKVWYFIFLAFFEMEQAHTKTQHCFDHGFEHYYQLLVKTLSDLSLNPKSQKDELPALAQSDR